MQINQVANTETAFFCQDRLIGMASKKQKFRLFTISKLGSIKLLFTIFLIFYEIIKCEFNGIGKRKPFELGIKHRDNNQNAAKIVPNVAYWQAIENRMNFVMSIDKAANLRMNYDTLLFEKSYALPIFAEN